MQLTDPNLHLKLQEMCECYLETDFTKQLNAMVKGSSDDLEEDAVKYLALAIMHGVSDRAKTLRLKKKKDNTIKSVLIIDDEKLSLPAPSPDLFNCIVDIIRSILHFEQGGGTMALAIGLRNSNIELVVKLKEKEGDTSLKLSYPEE